MLIACVATAGGHTQQPTFRSGADVVLIDVAVVEHTGRPVSDLKTEDFTVAVDGKKRNIVSAQFVRYDVTLARSPSTVPAAPSPAAALPIAPPPPRNVLIVIDNDSMEPGSGLAVKKAANAFLHRFGMNDRFAVATIPFLRSEIVFARDRDAVRRSLDAVITGYERFQSRFNIGIAEAMAMERSDSDKIAREMLYTVGWRECFGLFEPMRDRSGQVIKPNGPCPADLEVAIKQMQSDAHLRGQRSLEALRDLGDAASQIAGPKTFLLISGGVPSPDFRAPGRWYSDIEAALAQGQVTLYTLYVEQHQFGNAKGKASPTAAEDGWAQREGIEHATSAAGGTWMEAIGTLDQYFDRVAAELSGAYLLGIEVEAADRDGRPHRVQVKVNRKNVDVRARKQYVIEPTRTAAADAADTSPAIKLTRRRAAVGDVAVPLAELKRTPDDVLPVIVRAGEYVARYERQFLALSATERTERALSKRKGDERIWAVAQRRATAADFLLVKLPSTPGWAAFRDVFEADGKPTRQHDNRLLALLAEQPAQFGARGGALNEESARYEVDEVGRNTNMPNAAMVFVHPAFGDRFVFMKVGEEVRDGETVWRIAYAERRTPTLVQGPRGDVPVSGTFWIEPARGRLVASTMTMDVAGTKVEVAVTYEPADATKAFWVPSQMVETYVASSAKLEVKSHYADFRRFDAAK